ncbi:DUF3427 domain-containing protein [Aestuariimicrobium kwangyangense]|uniref:DUF3427 domain-containing protein n=1 Tax=Aestuariimicrobium kwangyangense TaxID=396389 RepID=UPI0003B5CFAC|nr:DUF3427 domain-containing protein [Aestuariimicrobium kwangyangense]
MDDNSRPEGLYDELVTSKVERDLARLLGGHMSAEYREVGNAEAPDALSRHVQRQALTVFSQLKEAERISAANEVLRTLSGDTELLPDKLQRLIALRAPEPGFSNEPVLPVGEMALLTNGPDEPAVGHEIRGELASANSVRLICAFIKWYGLRTLSKQLERNAARGIPFRVITTTYLGSTDRKALDQLVREFGAQVKVHYEIERTRLHAKAWMFERNTGFHTAYVGSSNLSKTALLDGVEWNVRLTEPAAPALLRKFDATFESYWHDPAFESYDPDVDADRFDQAIAEASGQRSDRVTISLSGLEVRPYPHQTQILEKLSVERHVFDRHRNLVVAATGTGKTVIAALDYRRLAQDAGRRPSLLFVAHRQEILLQAQRTYREVLNDPNFGETYVAGTKPETWAHVFASIQSLNAGALASMPADAFDVVVIDEFHHAAAASYRQLLSRLQPIELLGLTATPERTDGFDVRTFFDGNTAAEIRLWDALEAELLSPFHYFGVHDNVDLRTVEWKRGAYDQASLDSLFTGNGARARLVLKELEDKTPDLGRMRALGFCAGVKHAEFMARAFNEAGVPSAAATGSMSSHDRRKVLDDLLARRINVIFSADLYNEGVDLPDVDTVMFLRPTESATIFLQQLGRGLRRTQDKAVLTVLDFVGHHRAEFRYDERFTAITGIPRGHLRAELEHGFPTLPSGCQILLDRKATSLVLENLKRQVGGNRAAMVKALRTSTADTLSQFLEEQGLELSDVIRKGQSGPPGWTVLQRDAGRELPLGGPSETSLLGRVGALAHVDDADRYGAYRRILQGDLDYAQLSPTDQAFARMLIFTLWPTLPFSSYADALGSLLPELSFRSEAVEVLNHSWSLVQHEALRLSGTLAFSPLRSHARYLREELLSALGHATPQRLPGNFREGVVWIPELQTDAFLITLHKDEKQFSPTTMYRDYALAPGIFHWESQSGTSIASTTGQRYINQAKAGTNVVLFTRTSGANEMGKGAPYTCLGTAEYVSHKGEKPIAITYHLDRGMPADVFREASVTAS